ncbi:hypothetical protein ACJ7K1_13760 [Paenibacillus elgii]
MNLSKKKLITKQVYVECKSVRTKQILKLEEELRELRKAMGDASDVPTVEEIKGRIDRFIEFWSAAATDEEKNKALKQLIDKIIYNRKIIRLN